MNVRATEFMLSPAASLGLKVYATLAMFADHADWLLFDGSLGFHDTIGRTVFPIFAFLLGVNLSRSVSSSHMLTAIAPRMALAGLAAHFFYADLYGSPWALNIMFTLAAAVVVCALLWRGQGFVAVIFGLLAGVFVDYSWFGILCVVLPWFLAKERVPHLPMLSMLSIATLLIPINGNAWAFLAFPLVMAAYYVQGDAPRYKWAFYAAYPLHLFILWVVSSL